MASSSSKKYEVFLSFRGEDTRHGFTSHLYDALCRKQIETFIDDDKLERGDEISPALLRAIQRSKIAVVIFSKNYASSKWCLRELTEIMKCEELHELIVMPVFYHVDPSDVRKQTGSFECYFANYEEKELQEEVQKWREVLTEASNLSGWDSSIIRPDSKLVGEIVETVWGKLRGKLIPPSIDFEGLVGIHERIEQVMSLLCLDMEDVRKIIGIWGMGGIGKTTIAQAVFKFISYKFDGACIIEKVGKRLEENGRLDCLERDVLSKLLHEENPKLGTPTIRPFIMEMLNQKKVFIVLDDLNEILQLQTKQLKTFVGSLINQCRSGSRIIITSRDKQVLRNCSIDDREIYEAEGFDNVEALKLFCKHANPTEDCMALSEKIVNFAKGNPLALEVLGMALNGKSKQQWENALNNLKGIVNFEIFDVLKISYDGLNDEEKKLFLDLACFKDDLCDKFDGTLQKELLDCEYSLSVLIAKSLVTVYGESDMEMHDLLQEMGREIVRRESPKNPGMRSRLWERDDVIRILKYNTGTYAVEGISLDMKNLEEDMHLKSQVFDEMYNLRFLLFCCMFTSNKVRLPYGLNCLPDELRILFWLEYPLRALPSNFNPKELVKLDLSGSNIEQLWEGTKCAPKLKWLNLSGCEHLTRIPNLSDFPLLVEVDLSYCKSLVDFPSSVQQHNNLRNLNLSGTAIEEVPSSIQSLTNLSKLKLEKCTRLKHISSGICKLKSLSTLNLIDCSQLETFPDCIKQLSKLKFLSLRDCKKLRSIPDLPEGLECLEAMDCDQLCQVPDASEFVRCINSKPHSGNYLYYHHHSVIFIFLNSLNLIKAVSNVFEESLRIMQRTQKGSGKPPNEFAIYLPGNKIPEWFSYKSLESSVNFKELRNDLVNRKFMGFAICAVFGFEEYYSRDEQFMRRQWQTILGVDCDFKTNYDHNEIWNDIRSYNTYRTDMSYVFIDSDHMLLAYCSFYSINAKMLPAGDNDYVDISIKFTIKGGSGQPKCCAVHPIYAEEPIEKIGATIQEIGETSGRRSDQSDDNDEEVEPHPKRICIQAINTP